MNMFEGEKNPFQAVFATCKRIDSTSIHYIKQTLSPLLYHDNSTICTRAREAILEAESNGKLTPESRTGLLEFQRQHLEKKLSCFGVLLQPHEFAILDDLVTYKGTMRGKYGTQRVLCLAPAPSTLGSIDDETNACHALFRNIDVLNSLSENNQPCNHFVQILAHDKTSREKFYVTDQDWELPTLSQVLLADLKDSHQKIHLRQKVRIIRDIIEATLFANRKEILLRVVSAESFLVDNRGAKMRVIFFEVDAIRRGISDSMPLHITGNIYMLTVLVLLKSLFQHHI